jgi:hypothetical protein
VDLETGFGSAAPHARELSSEYHERDPLCVEGFVFRNLRLLQHLRSCSRAILARGSPWCEDGASCNGAHYNATSACDLVMTIPRSPYYNCTNWTDACGAEEKYAMFYYDFCSLVLGCIVIYDPSAQDGGK